MSSERMVELRHHFGGRGVSCRRPPKIASAALLLLRLLVSLAGAVSLTSSYAAASSYSSQLPGQLTLQRALESRLLHVSPSPVSSEYPDDDGARTYFNVTADWEQLLAMLPDSIDGQALGADDARTCLQAAKAAHPDVYDPSMLYHNRTPGLDYPGGAPRALWRWPGRITRKQFDDVRKHPHYVGRPRRLAVYKLWQRRLFRAKGGAFHKDVMWVEEMLLVAAYLFDLPNMDFALSVADEPYSGMPVLQYSLNMHEQAAGFSYTYATDMWRAALTAAQSAAWAACVEARYPPGARRSRALWRGSTTDPKDGVLTAANVLDKARVRLHVLSLMHEDVLDARVARVVQVAMGDRMRGVAGVLGSALRASDNRLPFEGFQRAAVIIDVDGNSFSSRFHQLAQHSGPVLKQASNQPGYFEHLFPPGVSINLFSNNLSDLPARASEVLHGAGDPVGAQQRMARNMRAVAAITLNKWAMLEALAYSLAKYAEKLDWEAQPPAAERASMGWSEVPRQACCNGGNLPPELVAAVRNGAPVGTGGRAPEDVARRMSWKAHPGQHQRRDPSLALWFVAAMFLFTLLGAAGWHAGISRLRVPSMLTSSGANKGKLGSLKTTRSWLFSLLTLR